MAFTRFIFASPKRMMLQTVEGQCLRFICLLPQRILEPSQSKSGFLVGGLNMFPGNIPVNICHYLLLIAKITICQQQFYVGSFN